MGEDGVRGGCEGVRDATPSGAHMGTLGMKLDVKLEGNCPERGSAV